MLSLTQLAINSLNDVELWLIIDSFNEIFEIFCQGILDSEIESVEQIGNKKTYNVVVLKVEQSLNHYDGQAIQNCPARSDMIGFTVPEVINHMKQITKICNFLLQRIEEPQIELIFDTWRLDILARKQIANEITTILNNKFYKSQMNNQCVSQNVDCQYIPQQWNQNNCSAGQSNVNETPQFDQSDLEILNQLQMDDFIINQYNFRNDVGCQNEHMKANNPPHENNAEPPQRPFLDRTINNSQSRLETMIRAVKSKSPCTTKFFTARRDPFKVLFKIFKVTFLFLSTGPINKHSDENTFNIPEERNWKRRRRK